jgi:hypothetical protein
VTVLRTHSSPIHTFHLFYTIIVDTCKASRISFEIDGKRLAILSVTNGLSRTSNEAIAAPQPRSIANCAISCTAQVLLPWFASPVTTIRAGIDLQILVEAAPAGRHGLKITLLGEIGVGIYAGNGIGLCGIQGADNCGGPAFDQHIVEIFAPRRIGHEVASNSAKAPDELAASRLPGSSSLVAMIILLMSLRRSQLFGMNWYVSS